MYQTRQHLYYTELPEEAAITGNSGVAADAILNRGGIINTPAFVHEQHPIS